MTNSRLVAFHTQSSKLLVAPAAKCNKRNIFKIFRNSWIALEKCNKKVKQLVEQRWALFNWLYMWLPCKYFIFSLGSFKSHCQPAIYTSWEWHLIGVLPAICQIWLSLARKSPLRKRWINSLQYKTHKQKPIATHVSDFSSKELRANKLINCQGSNVCNVMCAQFFNFIHTDFYLFQKMFDFSTHALPTN